MMLPLRIRLELWAKNTFIIRRDGRWSSSPRLEARLEADQHALKAPTITKTQGCDDRCMIVVTASGDPSMRLVWRNAPESFSVMVNRNVSLVTEARAVLR
jgi:hypothetical protein